MEIGESVTAGEASDDAEPEPESALRITDVRGLYHPAFDDRAARNSDRRIRCGDCPGYVSQDDRGRVFVNHRPRRDSSEGWEHVRMRDTQYIELTARVRSMGGPLPANASVRWTWSEPDDSSDTNMHPAARREIDANADQGGDNRGRCDYPSSNSTTPAYEAIASYALSNAQAKSCETLVVDGKSRVRLHLTNVGGDGFRVRAELVGTPAAVHETGIMRMWKRIDVAYFEMEGDVPPLPIDECAREFEIAFVQFDFTVPTKIAYREFLSSTGELNTPARELFDQVFTQAKTPGWYCLIAADLDLSAPDSPTQTVYDGPGRIVHEVDVNQQPMGEWVAVPDAQSIAPPSGATFRPKLREAGLASIRDGNLDPIMFGIDRHIVGWPNPGEISFRLVGMRYVSDFEATDGALRAAYRRSTAMFPTRTRDANGQWSTGGFGLGINVSVELEAAEGESPQRARGVTPTVLENSEHYWIGRSIVFTGTFRMQRGGRPRSQPYDRVLALRTVVHELTHAFGLPHACGYHSYDDPPDAGCAMAVPGQWLYEPDSRRLQRDHFGRSVPHLCPRHILAVRQTHLEDNPALWTW
jgi:hypothetical protein